MNERVIYEKLWELMLGKIRDKVGTKQMTQTALANQIGVKQPTINRWLKGERGKDVELRTVISIILHLGVGMDELAKAMGKNELATILAYFVENEEISRRMASIVRENNEGRRKIESEIDFVYSQICKSDSFK